MTSARMIKALLLTAATAATLSACNRDKDKPAAPAPVPAATVAETPATAGAPFGYKSETPYATVELKLPQAVQTQPDLHVRLYADSVKDLKAFVEGAQADRTEAGGDQGMPAYESLITFDTPVETGKLFSLARSDYEFTGGAHGNTAYTGVLWDKAMKRPVAVSGLLKPGVALSSLDNLLCAAVNAEKKKRDPQAETVSLNPKDASGWSCPHAADTPVVLAPGTEPGKAGGLVFLVGPYQVGPYAEGAYQVPLPQAAIRSLLAPAYADEFAGSPVMPKAN
ncbi:DUF3298 and DUF4163 domain-containing protein [Brevundimonas goettingensis]|uniref:DUF3298 and DUF4163 domain-containing protein n=1 Tax=Brevundimonas goettingensis TaxID=2774190 RepID=A0A975C109_9CAUL|nr:DUF3298 and DUF4163 domain-containing protein [Brevundimonas goettingensis]QTC91505.1 DUF3298 and DUF4163 domain-containing protein [Brevundimonas goettingensis]